MDSEIINSDMKYIFEQEIKWNSFEGKTILITGANGILGYYIVRVFMYLNDCFFNRRCKILALCRSEERAKDKFRDLIFRDDLEIMVQDVCQEIKYCCKINYIIHAASQASPKYYGKDPVGTLNANVFGTNNVLKLASEKNAESVLFISSGEVYGEVGNDKIPTKETDYGYIDPTNFRSCYSESKRLGETMCVSWNKQFEVPVKIVRPFHTYGPGILRTDGRVFSDFIFNIIDGEDIILKSDGKATRAFCYISDATRGFFTVLLNGKNGEAYNVGNNFAEVSILELAEILIGLFPEKKLKINPQPDNEYIKSQIVRNCPDINKISEIGWNPKISIEEGFRRTILSYL
jgi:UDP-glucuronate decarboxylase